MRKGHLRAYMRTMYSIVALVQVKVMVRGRGRGRGRGQGWRFECCVGALPWPGMS